MRIKRLTATIGMILTSLPVLACTSLNISDAAGHFYHGRTMELESDQPPSSFTWYPAGTQFTTSAPDGSPGIGRTSCFKIMAITAPLADKNTHELAEGLNSAGLAFSENMMPRSAITPIPPEQYKRHFQ